KEGRRAIHLRKIYQSSRIQDMENSIQPFGIHPAISNDTKNSRHDDGSYAHSCENGTKRSAVPLFCAKPIVGHRYQPSYPHKERQEAQEDESKFFRDMLYIIGEKVRSSRTFRN